MLPCHRSLSLRLCLLLLVLTTWEGSLRSAEPAGKPAPNLAWQVGVARVEVTPKSSMWMAGYAGRKKPSEGVASPLFCKATAIADADGNRLVVVTCDLIGVPRTLRDRVEADVQTQFKLPPASLLMNASHTHCGPEFRAGKIDDTTDERAKQGAEYFDMLHREIVALVGRALQSLAPAKLEYVHARCGFAMNRRTPSPKGYQNSPWSEGPVDHEVPVLRAVGADGKLRAVLFGYACHNTTIGFYQFCADYAGFAQEHLETKFPELHAAFVMGCGGDQNPYPRGEVELARHHGKTLGIAVEAALQSSPAREVHGPLRTALKLTSLEFAPPPPQAVLEQRTQSPNTYEAAHAKRLLKQLAETGKIETRYDTPIQAVSFGNDLVLVAFPGETVIDYVLRVKRELSGTGAAVWVAGYSNDVFGYIPSRRVLEEGGYEGGGAMLYGRFPGPFTVDVEDRMMGTAAEVLKAVGVSR